MISHSQQSSVKVTLCSHDSTVNQGKHMDLSPWVIECSVGKHIKGEGQWSLVLVPAPAPPASAQIPDEGGPTPAAVATAGSWLEVVRPDDLVNIYLSDGASGDVRVMFGYVDSIERIVEVLPQTGALRTRFAVFGTDFTKVFRLTNLYFNPWASEVLAHQLGAQAAGASGATDNLAGAELLRQGLKWFGTPADIIESHLLVVLGYQAQWRLPPSYPAIPPAANGNVLTGGRDTRADADHLRLILERRVSGLAGASAPLAAVSDQRLVDPDGPGPAASFGFSHPLRNGAGLTRAETAHFLALRPNRGPHLGVDVTAAPGTPVHPIAPGTIEHLAFRRSSAARVRDAGNFIVLRHEVAGLVFRSRYMHLQDWYTNGHDLDRPAGPDLALLNRHPAEGSSDPDQTDFTAAGRPYRAGDRVSPTDVIAYTGDTGNAAGHPHLHFELSYVRALPDGTRREVFVDPQRLIPSIAGGPGPTAASLAPPPSPAALLEDVLRHRRGQRAFRTLLDLLDRSYIEREHIDGFLASEQLLSESGSLLTLLQSRSNECMNELFFDLRLAGRNVAGPIPAFAPDLPMQPDELGGNLDAQGVVTAPAYVPAVILREYPFTTISAERYPSSAPVTAPAPVASAPTGGVMTAEATVSAGLDGPVYGLPAAPGVFFSSRRHPVRTQPVRPITSETPSDATAPATQAETARARPGSYRYIDTAVLTLDRILRMEVGRSDHDYFNVIDVRSSDLQADLKYLNRGVVPLLSYDSFVRHGMRVREIFSTFTQMGLAASDASLRKTLARWAILNDHWHQHANQYLAGTIVCLPLLTCRVGYRLDLPELDECYYVEGVRHDWAISPEGRTSLRTSLTVTRGQPLIRRPSETVRHVSIPGARPGATGSTDSDGLDAQVGGAELPGTGQTVFAVASAVSAGKPAPAVTVNARDIFLRRAIGTRYFATIDPTSARSSVLGGTNSPGPGGGRR